MHSKWLTAMVVAVLLGGSTLAAQGTQTGILRGTVVTPDKVAVAGATVTVKSPALQAERTTLTEADGTFIFRGLPPGTYSVAITKDTFKPTDQSTDVPLGGVAELNITVNLATRSETVSVTADVADILTTATVGANITKKIVDALAAPRSLAGIASLSPAVTMNTPNSSQLTISGGFAYDNVFLINGIDISDNLFGSPQRLFIEDAIQETQVLTSGISAEYGRFGGGVVNAITKSGGNSFSGSFRSNMSNPTWSTLTPFDVDNGVTHTSKLNNNYEATLGGPIVRDRLWFFGATRLANIETQQTFNKTGINHTNVNNNKRGEIKLTGSPNQNHTLQFNYIVNNTTLTTPPFSFSIDPSTIYTGSEPNSIIGGSWRGLLHNRVFAEAGYSQRKFAFLDEGGSSLDIVNSPFIGLSQLVNFNAPYFDATDPEHRDNRQLTGAVSYSVARAGRHDLKAGYEWFRSHRTGGNSQSSTGYVFDADYLTSGGLPVFDADGFLIPVFQPGKTLIENWIPVRGATLDTDVQSLYLQDHWAAGSHFSFDLGIRYEKANSKATGGILGVDTSTVVPRLAVAWDPKGDGHLVFHATYGHYAGKYNETLIGANNNVGNPDLLLGIYRGPAGSGRNFAPGFNPANYETVFGSFPTANVSIAPGLSSPITKEFTVSGGRDINNGRGNFQLTYVMRRTNNFIDDVIDIGNGTTDVVRSGIEVGTFTNIIYSNTNLPLRRYQALVFQSRYNLRPNWSVAGNWTVQLENDGTFEGEATNQPGLPSIFNDYLGPDGTSLIYTAERHLPVGRLSSFQRNKLRLWTIYSWDFRRAGTLTASGLVRFDSPLTYSLVATGEPLSDIQLGLLAAAGYPDSPSDQSIYFSGRGTELYNSYALLDTSFTYDLKVFKTARPFLKVDIYNLFNSQKLITFDTTIFADWDGPVDALGIPTNFIKADTFGTATSAADFPQPFQGQTGGRTFLFSLGIRF